ncbi:hypothetical protein FJ938_09545 [Mesorhizobium sp. B2-4-14]|nr:hypothetical protein FJ938_09545 [Mesorhizobium sp. B2-4-14]
MIWEFCCDDPDVKIIGSTLDGEIELMTIGEIYPSPYGPGTKGIDSRKFRGRNKAQTSRLPASPSPLVNGPMAGLEGIEHRQPNPHPWMPMPECGISQDHRRIKRHRTKCMRS